MLFTNMTEAFFLAEIICDNDGKPYDYRYLELNPAYEFNTGIKKEQILSKSALEVFSNENPVAIEKYGKVALSGKPAYFEIFSSAGKHFDIYAFSPEKGRFAAVFRDITERKHIEAFLKKKEQNFSDLLDSIQDGLFELNQEWKFVYINQRAAYNSGFEPDELMGENIWEKFPYIIGSKLEAVYREVMETRKPAHLEIKSLVRNKWFDVNVNPSASGIFVFWRILPAGKRQKLN